MSAEQAKWNAHSSSLNAETETTYDCCNAGRRG
jgi:hypothetical protein